MAQQHNGRSQAAEWPSTGLLATADTAQQPSRSNSVGSLRHLPEEQLAAGLVVDHRTSGGASAAPGSAASNSDQQHQPHSLPAAGGGASQALSEVSSGSPAPAIIKPQPARRDGASVSSAVAPAVIRPQPAKPAAAVLGAASAAPTMIRPQRAAQHLPTLAEEHTTGGEAGGGPPRVSPRQGSPELQAARSAASVMSEALSRESQQGESVHAWTTPVLHVSLFRLVHFAEIGCLCLLGASHSALCG